MDDDPIRQPMHGESRSVFLRSTFILFIVLLCAAGLFGWSYVRYQNITQAEPTLIAPDTGNDVATNIQTSNEPRPYEELLSKIEKHLELPGEPAPEVSIVNDADILRESQPFFENVAVGDVLIVYDDYAIIYRESDDTIVNSGVVNNTDSGEQVTNEPITTDAPGADVSVEIRNGTAITGYASRTKEKLVLLAYTIAGVGNASKNSYESTVIVVKRTTKEVAITALEELFKVEATLDLPAGEKPSSADILLLLGGSE